MSDSSAEVKNRIIEAAKHIIASSGVANTSLQAIADEAGISKGSLYYYFKTKNAILYSVINEDFRISKRIMQQYHAGELDNKQIKNEIYKGIEERLHKKAENKLHLYLAYEAMIGNEEIKASYQAKYKDWLSDITEGFQIAFDLSPELAQIFAYMFICLMDGWCMQNIMETDVIDEARVLKAIRSLNPQKLAELIADSH